MPKTISDAAINSANMTHLQDEDIISRDGVRFGRTRCGILFRRKRFTARIVTDSEKASCKKCKKPGSTVLL